MQASSLAAVSCDSKPAVAPRWTVEEVLALYEMPLMDLLWRAQEVHRTYFDPNAVQRSTLLSVKTGGCSEDCSYCSQSARYDTETGRERLMPVDEVVAAAKAAKDKGASRFCMGAAWRGPKDNDLDRVLDMVREVKALGMQTCVTLGMLKDGQAEKLKEAGLDYYNHNLDTDKEFYGQVIKTHTHDDRLDTLDQVRDAGINVCSGGIIGMGESRKNRAALIVQLANLPKPPESVPINNLVPIPGTPLADNPRLDPFEFVRTIAAARIAMPTSWVRLSAGRQEMSDELQAMCFLAGANSMFYGDFLLTTGNPDIERDDALFARLGIKAV
ncbi:biotin synthase BioB [Dechloromonas sp. XY25]|uniref:Biotin synthase n=1 Tax=Dechloromonas hankyongensis TaxID=2908002 RepID=A0ABS9K5M7_9RHOO|nr:biotin synthase BioB [Dechloromonas hankyongensis]MCG2578456.1 biotin synthase BioB [Dechloromonas hankyongensis]